MKHNSGSWFGIKVAAAHTGTVKTNLNKAHPFAVEQPPLLRVHEILCHHFCLMVRKDTRFRQWFSNGEGNGGIVTDRVHTLKGRSQSVAVDRYPT